MRIEDPAILKSGRFRLPRERDHPLHRHVGLDGDAEPHVISPSAVSYRRDAEKSLKKVKNQTDYPAIRSQHLGHRCPIQKKNFSAISASRR